MNDSKDIEIERLKRELQEKEDLLFYLKIFMAISSAIAGTLFALARRGFF